MFLVILGIINFPPQKQELSTFLTLPSPSFFVDHQHLA